MNPGPLVAAHNASAEADDGLVLARLLARLLRRGVVVARVLPDLFEHPGAGRDEQRAVRERVEEIREPVNRLLPQGREADIVPVLDPSVARGLHDIAEREKAAMLVLGSSHHGHLGRVLLGGSAELVVNGSPCGVAVAPPGFRMQGGLEPAAVGVAYDESPAADAALLMAAELATRAGAPLRVLSVLAPWWDRPIGHHVRDPEEALDAGATRAVQLGVPVEQVERELLHGDPGTALAEETSELGLLVMGSRGRGGLRRAMLGSVSTHVLRHARCPLVVCPAA